MKLSNFFKTASYTAKAMLIAVLVLLMFIPIGMIESLVGERSNMKEAIRSEISGKWGDAQTLTGPILVLPVKDTKEGSTGITYAYFLPETFNVKARIMPELFSISVYNIVGYQSDMAVSGNFLFPDVSKLNLAPEQIQWQDAFLLVGVPYLQGIKNSIVFNWDGKPLEVLPSVVKNDLIASGITIKLPIDADNKKDNYTFDFNLILNGTDSLSFLPIGQQTNIDLKSEWNSVSFIGDFLPNKKVINEGGFDAQWDIFSYNRNYPQMWVGSSYNLKDSALGVDLLQPVDLYQKTTRSVKYAILFISLTFITFFMVELLSHKRIHPIQYLLVSFALALFYCLLLSLSEHIGFGLSYLIASSAIVLLVTFYCNSIFKTTKQTVMMFLFLSIIYFFLYVILQLEEMSLLLGSIGLFVVLAIVMYMLRKIDWYKKDTDKQVENPE